MSIPERFLEGSDDHPHAYTVGELIAFLRELPPGMQVWSPDEHGVALVVELPTSRHEKRILTFNRIEVDEEDDDTENP